MTTIDHQQAAVEAAAKALFVMRYRVGVEKFELQSHAALSAAATHEAANAIAAAAPHLRAAWEHPIRELCEAQIERANGPLSPRGFSGQPFPAMVSAVAILALLEGGGGCCEHPKCPGGSLCCCQKGGAE